MLRTSRQATRTWAVLFCVMVVLTAATKVLVAEPAKSKWPTKLPQVSSLTADESAKKQQEISREAVDRIVRAQQVKAWIEICTAHARDYQIEATAKPGEKFTLLPTPVFRHSQLVRGGGQDIGAIWLWLQADGRPGVVGTVFTYPSGSSGYRNVVHELHSLAIVPLTAVWRGRLLWTPQRAGLDWKLIPGAPPPARSAAQRLRQVRLQANRFKAHSIDHQGGRWELRLIPKPVYRYQPKTSPSTLDGALFAFCQGTDPEIFLAIEARRTTDGFQWNSACAAFSDYELHVRRDDIEVWKVPKMIGEFPNEPHFGKTVARIKLPEDTKPPEDR